MESHPGNMHTDWLMARIGPLNRKALKGSLTPSERWELDNLNELRNRWKYPGVYGPMDWKSLRWTKLVWDVPPGGEGLKPYLRLTPDFMDLEAAGFSWGLSIGGFQKNEADAYQLALGIEKFMDQMLRDAREEFGEEMTPSPKM